MSDFLDDLWSNLDNSPTRQRPAAGAMATAQPAATQPQFEVSRQFTSTPAPTRTQPVSVSETVRQTPAPRARKKEVRFFPKAPRSLEEAGLSADMAGRLILKLLAARGSATGRRIAAHIRLGFTMVEEVLNSLRREQMVALKGDAIAGDYTYIITQKGLPLAQSLTRECTYFGSAPVTLQQYLDAMKLQSVADQVRMSAE